MATPLYPATQKRVVDATEAIIAAQIEPWGFLKAGACVQVKRFDGREISYQGITFNGSPREVFWSRYIEPFLENLIVVEIALTLT